MNKDTFIQIMRDAVNNPRLTALFVSLQMAESSDRHYFEDYCGFQYLRSFTESFDYQLLEQAIRKFDYILETDLKYVRAISYYGKAIAFAYCQTGGGFRNAYFWLSQLLSISTFWGPDRMEFIQELQTEARHLLSDIAKRDKTLNPIIGRLRYNKFFA